MTQWGGGIAGRKNQREQRCEKKDTPNVFETGRTEWELGERFDEFHGWGQNGTGDNGQHSPQAKAEVVLQTRAFRVRNDRLEGQTCLV